MTENAAYSIGIIGGADGPTSIFVAASPQIGWWIAAGCAAALIIVGVWLYRRKKRKE